MVAALGLCQLRRPQVLTVTSGKKPLHGQRLALHWLLVGAWEVKLPTDPSVYVCLIKETSPDHTGFKTHHFKLTTLSLTSASSSHARYHLLRSGLVLLVHDGSQKIFFLYIPKSLWGPSYFSAKRLLSSRSSVFPISTMTGSTFQCPGKWNYQLANCTGRSGGLPLRTTVRYCEFQEVLCLPPPHF